MSRIGLSHVAAGENAGQTAGDRSLEFRGGQTLEINLGVSS